MRLYNLIVSRLRLRASITDSDLGDARAVTHAPCRPPTVAMDIASVLKFQLNTRPQHYFNLRTVRQGDTYTSILS